MEATGFPTSADIYLELDGRKIAVVQGYTARRRSGGDVLSSAGTPRLRRGRNDGERQGAVPHGAAGRPPV